MPGDICLNVIIRQNLLLSQTRGKYTENHIFSTKNFSDEHSSAVKAYFQLEVLLFTTAFFGCPLLQEQLLLSRADQTVQSTSGLLAAVALAFVKPGSGSGAAVEAHSTEKAHQNLEAKFSAEFRSCFA